MRCGLDVCSDQHGEIVRSALDGESGQRLGSVSPRASGEMHHAVYGMACKHWILAVHCFGAAGHHHPVAVGRVSSLMPH